MSFLRAFPGLITEFSIEVCRFHPISGFSELTDAPQFTDSD
jgi:hypothetical protein